MSWQKILLGKRNYKNFIDRQEEIKQSVEELIEPLKSIGGEVTTIPQDNSICIYIKDLKLSIMLDIYEDSIDCTLMEGVKEKVNVEVKVDANKPYLQFLEGKEPVNMLDNGNGHIMKDFEYKNINKYTFNIKEVINILIQKTVENWVEGSALQ